MKAKDEKKHSQKSVKTIIIIALVAILALVCAVKTIGNISDIKRLKVQTSAAEQQLKEQEKENDSLKAALNSEDKDEYIEQKAREKGYGKDGEVVYYDISSSK